MRRSYRLETHTREYFTGTIARVVKIENAITKDSLAWPDLYNSGLATRD